MSKSQSQQHHAGQMDVRKQLLATARKLGDEAAQAALDGAETVDASFGTRAYAFIVSYIREHGPVAGEAVTLAARCAGIKPAKDDRAFGAIYAKALRNQEIKVVDTTHRVRGHGSAGGKVYAAMSLEGCNG